LPKPIFDDRFKILIYWFYGKFGFPMIGYRDKLSELS